MALGFGALGFREGPPPVPWLRVAPHWPGGGPAEGRTTARRMSKNLGRCGDEMFRVLKWERFNS